MSNAGWAAPNTKFITAFEEWLNGIEKEMGKRIESGSLVKAESLDELAEKIGVPADQLKSLSMNTTQPTRQELIRSSTCRPNSFQKLRQRHSTRPRSFVPR
ncbi:hypothetical protein [Adlercreutzia mucosicola]|uniref:hypothetical protein n=1 Tax=Adlercreutzia mucosicola TaxID=580026 RepID=UPI001F46B024|nr:hypothetical protein [Adlercreutzia mucosicola]MCR2033951.1 hypothetical protein [Adlercreutzia mucosicola]